jgi:hypothetical protein
VHVTKPKLTDKAAATDARRRQADRACSSAANQRLEANLISVNVMQGDKTIHQCDYCPAI